MNIFGPIIFSPDKKSEIVCWSPYLSGIKFITLYHQLQNLAMRPPLIADKKKKKMEQFFFLLFVLLIIIEEEKCPKI